MRSPCGAGSHALGFDFEGGVFPCEQLTNFPELRMGSVFDDRSLHDLVMTSPVVRNMRSRKVENIDKCSDCSFRMFCAGGCTAEAFSVHRTLHHEDAQCAFYKAAFEGLLWKLHDNPGLVEFTGQFRSGLPDIPPGRLR
jgi:uncharacterized protein